MSDAYFMQRAIELAGAGLGNVSPNPMVGCVIVYNDEIIGEGWHRKYGAAHAEVNAIASVSDKKLIGKSNVYISLEPCSFHGKTPACTDLLLRYKPNKVIIACEDPNPKVSGKGIELLKEGGIETKMGVLREEAMALNKRFFILTSKHRPYIILKWAQSKDGFMARSNFDSKWISNKYSRQLVHKWRTQEDAILVGRNTVVHDNPQLTARDWQGANPIRVILDPGLNLESTYNVFSANDRVLIINLKENKADNNIIKVKVGKASFLKDLIAKLYDEHIGSIIVEGGAKTLNEFISAGYWDEARIFTSEATFGDGITAPILKSDNLAEQSIMGDRLRIIYNTKTKMLWQKN